MIVEGVCYEIDWREFRSGASFFVPCLDIPAAKETVLDVLGRLRIKVDIQVSIESGIKGLRIWRV